MDMGQLLGKRALVTGSSRGIGRALALALAREGADVIIHCVARREKAEELCTQIKNEGGSARVAQADLSQPDGAACLMREAGDIDILILNASVQIRRPWREITREEALTQLQCNFLTSLELVQRAAPAMQRKRWGRIVAIGSVQERKPHPDMLIYSASKAAQTNMVQSLAAQLAADGITVNSVAPGVIYTDRNVEALSDPAYAGKVTASIPAGFYGMPEDCAGIVRLLCTDEGRYITGQSIYVDGGKSL